jgi:hypothetical protein
MPQYPDINTQFATATDEDLARFKAMPDDQLLRSALTLDTFSIVESSRRLREATRRLTNVLIGLTFILVLLTVILVLLTGALVWQGFFDREFDGGIDPIKYVLSTNLHRRHLTESQIGMVGANLETLEWGGDRSVHDATLHLAPTPPDAAISDSVRRVDRFGNGIEFAFR